MYTFDAGGVSGHPNHAATAAGVLQWWADTPTSSSLSGLPQLWQLQTVGLPCKYAGKKVHLGPVVEEAPHS